MYHPVFQISFQTYLASLLEINLLHCFISFVSLHVIQFIVFIVTLSPSIDRSINLPHHAQNFTAGKYLIHPTDFTNSLFFFRITYSHLYLC